MTIEIKHATLQGQDEALARRLNGRTATMTKAQASEVLTHVAFYAGWPNAMSAVPVVKSVFESRAT